MFTIDKCTVILTHFATDVVCVGVLLFLWVQNRRRFAGMAFWVADLRCQTAAVLLIMLRGSIPDRLSIRPSWASWAWNVLCVGQAGKSETLLSRLCSASSTAILHLLGPTWRPATSSFPWGCIEGFWLEIVELPADSWWTAGRSMSTCEEGMGSRSPGAGFPNIYRPLEVSLRIVKEGCSYGTLRVARSSGSR